MSRAALWATIPMTILLPPWIWLGRIVFGVGGWGFFLLAPVAALLLVVLLITTALSFTQDGATARGLTGLQTWSHVLLWAALFVTGAVMPDFGDTDDSRRSLLTQAFGYSDSLYDTSLTLAMLAGAASMVGWLVLLLSLTAGRRRLGA